MKKITHGEVFKVIERWAPQHFAYDWDHVGLQVGSQVDETNKVMVTLDVLQSVVDEAIEKGVNLIVAHHPLLFRPLKKIDFQSVKGKIVKKLIEHNITVYAAHTNLDIAESGVNDLLLDKLGIENRKPLITTHKEQLIKLVVFVPLSHVEEVRNALGEAGAGHIGNYSHCTFQTKGHGTFMPLEGTNPYIGTKHQLEIVDEMRIETIVSEKDVSRVLHAMKKAHPYEEVAYDLYPLNNEGKTYGLGRIGKLEQAVTLEAFVDKVKKAYHVNALRVTGDMNKQVQKIAVIGGSGEKYMERAKLLGADVLITGDVTFHIAQDAEEMGLAIIDPGHYVEEIMKEAMQQYLKEKFENIEVIVSETNTNPFQFF